MLALFSSSSRLLLRLMLLAILAGVGFWMWQLLLTQPAQYYPSQIDIPVQPGSRIVLGQSELAARHADRRHIAITRSADGQWWLGNISDARGVEVRRVGQDILLQGHTLAAGQTFTVAGKPFAVESADGVLLIRDAQGERWRYDGQRLRRGDDQQPACPDQSRMNWAKRQMKMLFGIGQALELGGLVSCGNRMANANLPSNAARIKRNGQGQYELRAEALSARSICLAPEGASCKAGQTLYEQQINLAGVSQMVVGRTHYSIHLQQDTLSLQSSLRMQLYPVAQPPAASAVQWQIARLDIWRIPGKIPVILCAGLSLLAFALLGALVVCLWPRSRVLALLIPAITLAVGLAIAYFWQTLSFSVLGLVLLGLVIGLLAALIHFLRHTVSPINALAVSVTLLQVATGLLAWALGPKLGEGWFLLMASLGMFWVVLLPAQSILWLLSMGLAAVLTAYGVASQLALGLASPEWGGTRFFASMAACSLIWFSLQYAVARLAHSENMLRLRSSQADWLLGLLALLALIGLLLQVIKGNEAGVFGFQPIEAAKLALLVLTAHFLALRLGWQHAVTRLSAFGLWLRFLFPVVLMLALMCTELYLVHDNSPFVLLSVWLWALLLAWFFASGNKASLLLALILLALGLGGIYAIQNGIVNLNHFGLYPDRIQTWIDPWQHQHTGEQLRRAIKLAESGNLFGTPLTQPWRVPEIQNDFAPDYFLSRFGAAGGAVLAGLQVLLLASLLGMSWGCLRHDRGSHDVVWAGRLRYFLIWGFVGFLLAHFVVSWGTNLSWLPVMGQPQPFLSSAGSLILLFLCPLHCLLASIPQSEN